MRSAQAKKKEGKVPCSYVCNYFRDCKGCFTRGNWHEISTMRRTQWRMSL